MNSPKNKYKISGMNILTKIYVHVVYFYNKKTYLLFSETFFSIFCNASSTLYIQCTHKPVKPVIKPVIPVSSS